MKKIFILSIFLVLLRPSVAQEFKSIEGQYSIMSKTLSDPPPNEKKDRVILSIQGNAAQEIFKLIAGPVKTDRCKAGLKMKSTGAMECFNDLNDRYWCTVGILIKDGTTVKGGVC